MIIPPYMFLIRQFRVVDGDSIKMEIDLGFHMRADVDVRLMGIDAPERRGDATRECGVAVTEVVRKWMASRFHGDESLILVSRGLDKYGRSLGDVLENGQPEKGLCDFLLEHNLVHPYDGTGERGFTPDEVTRIIADANALLED